MDILVIGSAKNLEECKSKFGGQHRYLFQEDHQELGATLSNAEVVFDFRIDEDPYQIESYQEVTGKPVFLNTVKITLLELSAIANHKIPKPLFGFNGLSTFLNREILEVSMLNTDQLSVLRNTCDALNTKFLVVDDRVGLVTPRIICMIINEAYYTVQEGTATREDIDEAMKLGTHYPYGPFEWCSRIGIDQVYELLEAVYEDTHDERYKICPLLKREYLLLQG